MVPIVLFYITIRLWLVLKMLLGLGLTTAFQMFPIFSVILILIITLLLNFIHIFNDQWLFHVVLFILLILSILSRHMVLANDLGFAIINRLALNWQAHILVIRFYWFLLFSLLFLVFFIKKEIILKLSETTLCETLTQQYQSIRPHLLLLLLTLLLLQSILYATTPPFIHIYNLSFLSL